MPSLCDLEVARRRQVLAWDASPRKDVPKVRKSQSDDSSDDNIEPCRRVATEVGAVDGTLGLASRWVGLGKQPELCK
jgi:hypothetical protein